jgi:predicted Zn-dependent protease
LATAQFNVSVEEEVKLGKQAAQDVDKKSRLSTGPELERVRRIAESILKVTDKNPYKFEFKVIEDKQVNAFAIPGGFVYVYTGLLKMIHSDAELASVIAHEITHVTHRHWAKQYEKAMKRRALAFVLLEATKAGRTAESVADIANSLTDLRYSRKDEQDADDTGIRLIEKAGYDPQQFVEMLKKLKKAGGKGGPAWASDHPDTDQRINNAQAYVNSKRKGGGKS